MTTTQGQIMLAFTPDIRRAIEQHAASVYPDECCGALLGRETDGRREVEKLVEIDNQWDPEERRRRFLITPQDFMRIERDAAREGLDVLGFYHSHPDAPARPSEFDREHAWPWYVYPILSVEQGKPAELRVWQLTEDREGYREIEVEG